jgi:hypothetical protein
LYRMLSFFIRFEELEVQGGNLKGKNIFTAKLFR